MAVIATLKEIKDNEGRVGLTPHGTKELVKNGHSVLVQKNAGVCAGFSNEEYEKAGAKIIEKAEEIVKHSDIIIQVKEPLAKEYPLLKLLKGKTLFTYLHLSGTDKSLTEELLKNEITAIAYETVKDEKGHLPLLSPMSEIAGVLAVQYGAEYLQKKYDGRGITLSYIKNTTTPEVVIVGGGTVGERAARTAIGLGANVTLLELRDERIKELRYNLKCNVGDLLCKNATYLKSTKENLAKAIKKADLLVGCVLVPGAKAPKVVTEEMIRLMKKGSVIVDVAIDQGGCVWGSKPTSHSNPVYNLDGKIFCCIPNMPGQVALQSTEALTNATLPYILKMANNGVISALKSDKGFLQGLNTYKGKITHKAVAEALGMMDRFEEAEKLL